MRLNYFGYYLENINENRKHLFDIRQLIRAFCSVESINFKNLFMYNGEHIYLFPAGNNIYLFLTTRSNEIIKRINTTNLNVGEINEMLTQNEHLGFSSYVYFKNNFIGFASTFFAPKINALIYMVDNIFQQIDLDNYKFMVQSLLHQTTSEEVLNINFIGKTTIAVERENTLSEHLINFLGGDEVDTTNLDSFEIVIKPKRKKNISDIVKGFVNSVEDNGLDKFVIKAKDELQDHLSELYIVGKGAISDVINTKDENLICDNIILRTENNDALQQKIAEFTADEKFTQNNLENIARFNNVNSWADFI